MDTSTVIASVDTLGRRIAPRRRRTVQEKLAIVAESRVVGTSVAEVSRRHAVNANQVFAWRRQQEQGVLGQRSRKSRVRLLPVQISEDGQARPPAVPVVASEGRLEVRLSHDVQLIIAGEVPIERVERVLALLRRLS